MGKAGKQRPPSSLRPPNQHLFTRLNYLYQAGTLISPLGLTAASANPSAAVSAPTPTAPEPSPGAASNSASASASDSSAASVAALSRFYLSSLRSVGLKTQTRLDPSVKRTICKRCDTLLVPGLTCTHTVENKSKGGKKRWADVLVVECGLCRAAKRYPVGMETKREYKLWRDRLEENGGIPVEKNRKDVGEKKRKRKRGANGTRKKSQVVEQGSAGGQEASQCVEVLAAVPEPMGHDGEQEMNSVQREAAVADTAMVDAPYS